MALISADRVKETSTTTGTGTLTLAGAVVGYRTFAAIGDTNTCHYLIAAVDADGNPTGDWEVGFGTYTLAGTTLTRGTVFSNSLGTKAKISFAAGTKHVSNVSTALNGRLVGCKLRLAGNQVVLTGATGAYILFDAVDHEMWDTDGFHEGVTNPSRITIPAGFDGTYRVMVHVLIGHTTSGADTTLVLWHRDSGGTAIDESSIINETNDSANVWPDIVITAQAVGGDYFEFQIKHSTGINRNVWGGTDEVGRTTFTCLRMGN